MRAFSKTSKLAIIGGSLAVALGTGALAAHAQNATDVPAASASASQLPGKDRDKGNKDDKGPAELAKKLGVSEDKLKEAMDSLRSEGSGEQKGERPDKSAMDQKLATALGIDVSKVEQAMSEMHSEREAEHRTELSSRLDEAVSKGTLSSSDKDSVLKAFDAGVLGGGPDGGHGGPERAAQ